VDANAASRNGMSGLVNGPRQARLLQKASRAQVVSEADPWQSWPDWARFVSILKGNLKL